MTLTSLQVLTWGTVAASVLSALLLAAGESGLPDVSRLHTVGPTLREAPVPALHHPNAGQRRSVSGAAGDRREPGRR